jgi:hypothetical protein
MWWLYKKRKKHMYTHTHTQLPISRYEMLYTTSVFYQKESLHQLWSLDLAPSET